MTATQKAELLLIEEPTPLEGWCTHQKACALFTLVETHKPSVIVDLGTFGGRCAVAFALACKSVGQGTVFAIDAWRSQESLQGSNDPANDKYWAEMPWPRIIQSFYQAISAFDVARIVVPWGRPDEEVAPFFRNGAIDMIHIDINHSEEVATRAVRTWFPKVAKGGIIIMDDIDWPGQKQAEGLMVSMGCERLEATEQWGIYRKL